MIALHEQLETEVFVNQGGGISIKQHSTEFGRDCIFVILPENVQRFIDCLQLCAEEIGAQEVK
jgi:hypothetical protein